MNFLSTLKSQRIPDFFALLAIALCVYLPLIFFIEGVATQQKMEGVSDSFTLPVSGSDSVGYVVLADNLLNEGVFSSSHVGPFIPDTFRTPGYPALLAFFKFIFGSYKQFPLIQVLFTVAVSFMVLRIGESLFGRIPGIIAAILYLCDPTVIFHSLILLSDTSHVFFTVLSVFLLFFCWKDKGGRHRQSIVFASGVALGVSVLIRPISMFLPLVLVPCYIFFFRLQTSKKNICIALLFFTSGLFLLMFPWLLRNRVVSGTWGMSSVASFNLFHYYVPEFLAYKENTTPDAMRLRLQGDLPTGVSTRSISSISNSKILNAISFKYLNGNYISYAKFHLVKTLPVFFSSGIKSDLTSYNNTLRYPIYKFSSANLTNFLLKGQWREFVRELLSFPVTTLEMIYLLVVVLLAVVPLFVSKQRFFTSWFWCLILYFSLLTGSVAYARFRLPLLPFLFLLSAFGATIVWREVKFMFIRPPSFNQ